MGLYGDKEAEAPGKVTVPVNAGEKFESRAGSLTAQGFPILSRTLAAPLTPDRLPGALKPFNWCR